MAFRDFESSRRENEEERGREQDIDGGKEKRLNLFWPIIVREADGRPKWISDQVDRPMECDTWLPRLKSFFCRVLPSGITKPDHFRFYASAARQIRDADAYRGTLQTRRFFTSRVSLTNWNRLHHRLNPGWNPWTASWTRRNGERRVADRFFRRFRSFIARPNLIVRRVTWFGY